MFQPYSVKKLIIRSNTVVFERLNNEDEDKNLSQETDIVNIVWDELDVKISHDVIDKTHPIKKIKNTDT